MKEKNMELKRLNMNIPTHLLDTIDEYADQLCLNRTSTIILLLRSGLEEFYEDLELGTGTINFHRLGK